MPQRIAFHAVVRTGTSSLGFLSNSCESVRPEGDRAGVLLGQLEALGGRGQKVGNSPALGLGETDGLSSLIPHSTHS